MIMMFVIFINNKCFISVDELTGVSLTTHR